MVTKKEIAEYLGISRTAVSLVLNNTPNNTISSTTRERILQAAKELGYREVETSPKLCFILYDRDGHDPRYMSDLQVIEQSASQYNYGLVFMNVTKEQDSLNALQKSLDSKEIDGYILSGDIDEQFLDIFIKSDTPYILYGLPVNKYDHLNYFAFDDKKMAFEATSYLIDQGHTRIALFTGSLDYLTHQFKLQGYIEAHEYYGIPLDRSLIQVSNDENGYELCRRAELLGLNYTAVFCVNTIIQFGVLQRLQSTGVAVPQDISLIGSGFTEFVKVSVPRLTTYYVEQAVKSTIVTMLVDIIQNPDSGNRNCSLSDFVLFEGGTVAPFIGTPSNTKT